MTNENVLSILKRDSKVYFLLYTIVSAHHRGCSVLKIIEERLLPTVGDIRCHWVIWHFHTVSQGENFYSIGHHFI